MSEVFEIVVSSPVLISYSQFAIYDSNTMMNFVWNQSRLNQGFAVGTRCVSFAALIEYGHAELRVYRGDFRPRCNYDRVIAVPLTVESGRVVVEGPEETPWSGRAVDVASGKYLLYSAQYATADSGQGIDLFFVVSDNAQPHVVLADDRLVVPSRFDLTNT